MLQHEAPQNEPRYDAETLRKVTALAHELKERQQETLSAREIETIGEEVGLERRFMQEALAQVVSPRIVTPPTATSEAIRLHRLKAFMAAWWAAGWTLPLIMMGSRIEDGSFAPFLFFLGWAVYLGGGILLTMLSRPPTELDGQASSENLSQRAARASPPSEPSRRISRSDLLDALFAIQHALEEHKQHRAFLSVDVVDSTGMKAGADPLVVEHSFGQFRGWVQEIVRAHSGEMQSAAGDGMMCVFRDEPSAIRAAREIQTSVEGFNAGRNRLGTPFRLRCGITAGTVALEPGAPLGHLNSPVLDRAATLQKKAEPGDIVVGSEVAAAALVELGGVAALPELVNGERVFSWRAAHRGG